jgi:hypothetical protein
MMFGRKSKLISYMVTWALVGVILLAIPTLVSPPAERTLTPNPSTDATTTPAANRTTTYQLWIAGSNNSYGTGALAEFPSNSANNQTLTVHTDSATNITIVTLGNAHLLTITSTAPANITVTTKSPASRASSAAPIASNIQDFALRLALILVPAVALSGLGMVRVRRRFRQFASDTDQPSLSEK